MISVQRSLHFIKLEYLSLRNYPMTIRDKSNEKGYDNKNKNENNNLYEITFRSK